MACYAVFIVLTLGTIMAAAKPILPSNLIHVPVLRQARDYTCGVCATQSLMGFWLDSDYNEGELAHILRADPEAGTTVANIEKFLISQNFSVTARTGCAIEDLVQAVEAGHPALVLIQAWPLQPVVNWRDDWDDGHYALVVGYDSENIFLMDPSTQGHYTYIPKAEFDDRWHDVDMADPPIRLVHWMLVAVPKTGAKERYHPDIPLYLG